MLDATASEVNFAINAVQCSARLVKEIQQQTTRTALAKDDRSPVTVADFTAQALVAHMLNESFPQDPLVAEESASDLDNAAGEDVLNQVTYYLDEELGGVQRDDVYRWIERGHAAPVDRFWTLDPLDGTKGFLRGDQFAVALALIESQKVKVAALGCPNLILDIGEHHLDQGCIVLAMRGGGCWAMSMQESASFLPIHVSLIYEPEQARVLRSYEAGHTNVDQIGRFIKAWGVKASPLILDSQAKYALLAAGSGDVCLRLLSENQPDYKEKIWDQAAGALIVEEAGGCITDLDGLALDFSTGRLLSNNRGILATNGLLHESALENLRRIEA
jgi:HAL2 family 3'(2'),5'-bisphosphate nucleotidase